MNMHFYETLLRTERESEVFNIVINKLSSIKDVNFYNDDAGNIIVKKGDYNLLTPCFCAHMDTVHTPVKKGKNKTLMKEYHEDIDDIIFSSPSGIGGDDLNGVFILLSLIEQLSDIQAVFFSQEEIGCIGASQIDISVFDNASCLIELDRKGNSDIIMTYCNDITVSQDFIDDTTDIFTKYQYYENFGTVTDVMELKNRNVDISAINLSCGYYNAHTKDEYTSWKDINRAFDLCLELSPALSYFRYEHEIETYRYNKNLTNRCIICDCYDAYNLYDFKGKPVCYNCIDEILEMSIEGEKYGY